MPWVGENLHPDDGYWLSRYLRFEQNCAGGITKKNPKTGADIQNWNYCNLDVSHSRAERPPSVGPQRERREPCCAAAVLLLLLLLPFRAKFLIPKL